MTDILERVISTSGNVRGIACNTTDLVAEACRRHDVGPTAAAALGRALTGAILLAALLKEKQSVTLRFEGNGPLGKIVTEAGYDGWARGYVGYPHADVPLNKGVIDVASGIGKAGFLTVIKNIRRDKHYQGIIQLQTSEIAEDIARYLADSEQTPSALSLGVQLEPDGTITAAGGFLVQSLPPADEQLIAELEHQISAMPPVTSLLIGGEQPAALLSALFANIGHKKLASSPLSYTCSCSRNKMEQALFSLDQEDLTHLLNTTEGTDVQCEFCRDCFHFSHDDLQKMLVMDSASHN